MNELPLDDPELTEALDLYVQHRIELGHPLTPTAYKLVLIKCRKWGTTQAVKALHISIENGWRGIFSPADTGGAFASQKPPVYMVPDARQKQEALDELRKFKT